MTSVLGSVTNWLVGTRELSPERTADEPSLTSSTNPSQSSAEHQDNLEVAPVGARTEVVNSDQENPETKEVTNEENGPTGGFEHDLQEVSEKAVHAAKEWGSYLFSFGRAATEHVAKTAKQLKDTVEDKTILGDFSREQEKFVTCKRERKKLSEAAVAPWVGYNEEEVMKTQILALSKDKRYLLRNPPSGVQFHFDYESTYPIAVVMLDEDPNLKALRFELVPKQIKEELFWRNYFYRVSLIKQSTQLTSLAQQRELTALSASGKIAAAGVAEKPLSPSHAPADEKEGEDLTVGSPAVEQEFVSDAFQSGDIIDEELKKEMHQLGVTNGKELDDGIPEWERELQAELQEYEVVGDEDNGADDADLELEIMKQIEAESKET